MSILTSNTGSSHSTSSRPASSRLAHSTIESLPEESKGVSLPPADPELWRPIESEYMKFGNYKHDIPKPEGNHWQNVLDPIMKRDKEMCDAWKDEVQNLLIFAGLFSAVVTAFLIESYQMLQPNPQDTAVIILTHIAARLDTSLNQTESSPTTPLGLQSLNTAFTPSLPAIRVNILWFLSLILSLTVVLVGIVSLQWLREHQKYEGAAEKDVFALHRMREEALREWQVPAFFAALPLLLEASLVLFLVGIATFLWNIQHTVAIWVIVAICVPLIFLVLTTCLPALQILTLYDPRCQMNISVPAYCPYKSPQSHIFCQLLLWVNPIFKLTSCIFTPLYLTLFKHPPVVLHISLRKCRRLWRKIRASPQLITFRRRFRTFIQNTFSPTHWCFAHLQKRLSRIPSYSIQDPEFKIDCARLAAFLPSIAINIVGVHSWTISDKLFLRLRTIFDQVILVKELRGPQDLTLDQPLFDLVCGLRDIAERKRDPSMIVSAYYCFREVASISNISEGHFYSTPPYAEIYLRQLLVGFTSRTYIVNGRRPVRLGAGMKFSVDKFSKDVEEQKLLLFLWYVDGIPELRHHRAELSTRLLASILTSDGEEHFDSWEWDFWYESDLASKIPADFDNMQQVLLLHALFRLTSNDVNGQLIGTLRSFGSVVTLLCRGVAPSLIRSSQNTPAFQRLVALLAYISDELMATDLAREALVTDATPVEHRRYRDPDIDTIDILIDEWADPRRFTFFWCSSLFLANINELCINYLPDPSSGLDFRRHCEPVFTTWLTYKNYVGATVEQFCSIFDLLVGARRKFEELEKAAARYAEAGDVEPPNRRGSQLASTTVIPFDHSYESSDTY